MSTLMDKTVIKDNFDINIWNRGAYYSEGEPIETHYDEWVLCAFTIIEQYEGYGTGDFLDEYNLELTAEEAMDLTLGYGDGDLIGDYISDNDFFLDMETFKDVYKNIPPRVQQWFDTVLAVL